MLEDIVSTRFRFVTRCLFTAFLAIHFNLGVWSFRVLGLWFPSNYLRAVLLVSHVYSHY